MPTSRNDIPIISVLMGVLYRREKTDQLRESVDSILQQTEDRFELLICDDGSLPEAKCFLDEYSHKDERIRLLRPGDKLDLASKLNTCLREARGRFIARMDDDDYSFPERFQKQAALLESRTDLAFVGTNVFLRQNGVCYRELILPEYPQIRDFHMTQPFVHPTLMFRREPLETVNGYSEDKRQFRCEDYDLFLRLYAKGYHGMNLQEPLLSYTVSESAKGNRTMRDRWNETATRWERFRELGELPQALPYVIKPLAVGFLPEPILERLKNRRL